MLKAANFVVLSAFNLVPNYSPLKLILDHINFISFKMAWIMHSGIELLSIDVVRMW